MLSQLIRPMEPRSHPQIFQSPAYRYQVKWDGVRMLAYVSDEEVRLQNRRLRDRTGQYPEIVTRLARLGSRAAVIDGELIVLDKGCPSFTRILERDLATRKEKIRHYARQMPATYVLFDILYYREQDLTSLPWEERQEILYKMLGEAGEKDERLHLTENFTDGPALFKGVQEKGLEGIVAKEKDSPYLVGRKSFRWLKIKIRRSRLCVVGGYTERNSLPASLLLGAYKNDSLLYIGRAGSGLSNAEWEQLARYFAGAATAQPPFANPPRGKDLRWVKPALVVVVEYLEWTESLRLRAPVIAGFSREKPEECRL